MSLSSTRWQLRLRRIPWFPPPWLCIRLCPPAPVRRLWLCLRRLMPVHLATVLLVRRSGRGSALRPPCALEAASASRVVRGRLLLRNLWVSGSGSHPPLPNPVRRLSVPPLAGLEGQGRGSVGGGSPPGGVSHTLPPASSSVYRPHPHAFVCPYFHQRGCSRGSHPGVDCQGCCGACSSSLSSFYSRLFVVWKTSGSWRPVIDLSLLNRFVDISHFRMETIQSVLMSVRQGDWMASIDLRLAYLQVPVHPESRRFLRFVAHGRPYQFKALCFGLSTAPQVFTRVMAPVSRCSSFLGHPYSSLPGRLARPGIVPRGPPPGSRGCLIPFVTSWESWSTRSSPASLRLRWYSILGWSSTQGLLWLLQGNKRDEFLSSAAPPASLWQSILGMLSSLSHLVPGGRLPMRSLQICLHRSWDRLDPSAPVPWSLDCLRDLRWWLRGDRFSRGVSLLQVSPDLDFWSDASDVG